VRLAHEQDFLGRAGLHELAHDLAAVELRVLDLAVELAVGKQPRPALAELDVRFGREDLLAPEAPGVLRATSHVASAFEHNRLETHLREQRGEQPTRTETDDDRPLLQCGRRARDRVIGGVGRDRNLPVLREPREHARLVRQFHVDDADEQDAGLFAARVVTAFEEIHLEEVRVADPQAFDHGRAQRVGRVVERQRQLGETDQRLIPGRRVIRQR
jgi:hypothetical protein